MPERGPAALAAWLEFKITVPGLQAGVHEKYAHFGSYRREAFPFVPLTGRQVHYRVSANGSPGDPRYLPEEPPQIAFVVAARFLFP